MDKRFLRFFPLDVKKDTKSQTLKSWNPRSTKALSCPRTPAIACTAIYRHLHLHHTVAKKNVCVRAANYDRGSPIDNHIFDVKNHAALWLFQMRTGRHVKFTWRFSWHLKIYCAQLLAQSARETVQRSVYHARE